jgi:hypothetical protein
MAKPGVGRAFHFEYARLLDRIHRYVRPRTYVEIGVYQGRSLSRALPGTLTIGVDPEPQIVWPISRRTQIFLSTSDAFFSSCAKEDVLDGRPLDLAFIDGMHHFEFALRDFINLEKWADPNTTILVHDCFPLSEVTAARDCTSDVWSGDVWKLVVILKRFRPDLRISVVDARPTGLALISGLDPTSTVLEDRYDEIVEEHLDLSYAWLDERGKNASLNRVPNDWSIVRDLLPAPFRRDPALLLRVGRALRPAQMSFLRARVTARAKHFVRRTSGRAPFPHGPRGAPGVP